MSDPVTFAILANGRIEALLGNTLVGIVAPYADAGGRLLGSVEAIWQMLLPVRGAMPTTKGATSMAGARRTLLHHLADWHEDADPVRYAGMILALRAQAEGER
jgi:hypothetical protein